MSEEEKVNDGVDELMEELGVTDAEKDVTEDPEKESAGTSEAELAQKALDESSESAESAESEEGHVPLAKYMGEKNRRREMELENAELRGENKARSEMSATTQTAVATKSPTQLLMEDQEVGSIEELRLTGVEAYQLARDEQAFESKQAESKTAETTAQSVKQAQTESCNAAKDTYADEGLEFSSILSEGEKLLTEGEMLDLSKSKDDFGKVAYEKCLHAIIRKGGDRAEQIQKLIDANNSNKQSDEDPDEAAKKKAEEEAAAKAKANSGKFDLEKELTSDDGSGEEAEQTPSKRLTQFMVTE